MKQINIVEDLHKGIDLKELAQKTESYKSTAEKIKKEGQDNDNSKRNGE